MRLCCCFPKRSNPQSVIPQAPAVAPQVSAPVQPSASPPPLPKLVESVKINSSLKPGEIAVSEYTPTSTFQGVYRYNCPVCLRYFSHILISACCSNYLCSFCADDLRANPSSFDVRCPHCNASPVIFNDVEPEAPVKFYSDSPQATFQRNTGGKFVEIKHLDIVVEAGLGDPCESDTERVQEHSELYSQFARTV